MKKILIVLMAVAIGLGIGLLGGCSAQRGNEKAEGAGTPGNPNNSTTSAPAETANLSSADKDFMNRAAQGGAEEVSLGQLAQQNGQSDAVKSFGERMVTDHKAAGDKLAQLAEKKGVNLDDSVSTDAQKEHDTLAKKKGAEFDRAYMALMMKDHQNDVKDFQKEADSGQDPDVKSFASSTLPTLQDHLNLAKQAKSSR